MKGGEAGGRVKQRTEQTRFTMSDTQTLGQLPSAPRWSGCRLRSHLKKKQPRNASCCPTQHQASGTDFSHNFEVSVWLLLQLTLVKVAGANCSTSSTAAYSQLEQPGSCFLDIFTAFNVLLPHLLSEQLSVMQVHNSCITDRLCRQEGVFLPSM